MIGTIPNDPSSYYGALVDACDVTYPYSTLDRWWCKLSEPFAGAAANMVFNPPMPTGVVAAPGTPDMSSSDPVQGVSNAVITNTQKNMQGFVGDVPTNPADSGSWIPILLVGGVVVFVLAKL